MSWGNAEEARLSDTILRQGDKAVIEEPEDLRPKCLNFIKFACSFGGDTRIFVHLMPLIASLAHRLCRRSVLRPPHRGQNSSGRVLLLVNQNKRKRRDTLATAVWFMVVKNAVGASHAMVECSYGLCRPSAPQDTSPTPRPPAYAKTYKNESVKQMQAFPSAFQSARPRMSTPTAVYGRPRRVSTSHVSSCEYVDILQLRGADTEWATECRRACNMKGRLKIIMRSTENTLL